MDYSWWPENVFVQYLITSAVIAGAVIFVSTILLMMFSFGEQSEFKEIRSKVIMIDICIITVSLLTSMVMALCSTIIKNLGLVWLIGIITAIFIISITITLYNIRKKM